MNCVLPTAIKGWAETMQSGEIDRGTFDKGMGVIIRESSVFPEL
ncbi:MAG: hypothetical protein ACLR13_01150 [Acutalibacteraceae bacterium]